MLVKIRRFLKSHINAYTKTTASGQTVQVAAHEREIGKTWTAGTGSTQTHTFDGGFMHDEKGVKHYVKGNPNEEQTRIEHLSSSLFRHLGIKTPKTQLVRHNGALKIASEAVSGAKEAKPEHLMGHKDVHDGYGADGWLAHYDVAGMSFSNILRGEGDTRHRIDLGGTQHYRAQGKTKAFGAHVSELQTLLDPSINQNTSTMYSKMSNDEAVNSIKRVVNGISDSEITKYVADAGFSGDKAQKISEALIHRREFMRHLLRSQGIKA